MTRHWQITGQGGSEAETLPEGGRVLILSPCENIHEMFEPTGRFTVVRGRAANLGAGMIANLQPDVIAAPVLGQDHDIFEIAHILSACRFGGTLCAVSRPPVRAGLVVAELRRAFPGLRIVSVTLGAREACGV